MWDIAKEKAAGQLQDVVVAEHSGLSICFLKPIKLFTHHLKADNIFGW